jgi:hypothetical protein
VKNFNSGFFLLLVISLSLNSTLALAEQDGNGASASHKIKLLSGASYDFHIGPIDMPVSSNGIIADVLIPPATIAGGKLGNKIFLYSGGFYLTGITNHTMWANGMMTAARVADYVPGTYASGQNDPGAQLYIVGAGDPDFDIGVIDSTKMSWAQWKDAVSLGADFYDGDHNGVYNPVDKNGNGKWDPDEDRPDILGDLTAWCVYSDRLPSALRLYKDVSPQGVEIRQTVFAFIADGPLANVIFIRYKIVNTGYVADVLDSVYFGVAADADIGDNGMLDLVGCDTLSNAGYTYHKFADNTQKWGLSSPCFLINILQGPVSYIPGETFTDNNGNGAFDSGIDTPIDTAIDVRVKIIGVGKYPGAKNLSLSSFVHFYGGADPADKFQLRNLTLGLDNTGKIIDPCTWTKGNVLGGINCADVNPYYMYSGDPVANIGWINNAPGDQKQISNTGPFKLVKNDTVSIVVSYVVGRGTDALNSISVAKSFDGIAQKLFDSNFSPVTGINNNSTSKINYKLYQNYPNPFNPSTTIKYSLAHAANVKLLVHNSLGQMVKVLVNSPQSAGYHEINFNAADLSSGVYFYTLYTGSTSGNQSFHSTEKMMLIK